MQMIQGSQPQKTERQQTWSLATYRKFPQLAGQHFMTGGRVASCGAGLLLPVETLAARPLSGYVQFRVGLANLCCTGTLAALCFVIGSLLGSALGESRWSPELMDFTNFIGILVLFVGMAGAGRVTLKLTASEDHVQFPTSVHRGFSLGFRAGASLKVAR
ncbi:unnamed protein product [Cladocopium goreaui]|uniref:Uncharacterized protein n=1 Tax=Cladocopium goreaui TaxID=2562237 RepID=A0A9P1G912_9DINO|nr:unnamed protein product [Cladocopium goreaui]